MMLLGLSICIALCVLLVNASPQRKSASVGATYSITNVETGNNVLVHTIEANGMVSFARAVTTGGKGIKGFEKDPGADALFGQGSLTVFEDNLYVVNPHSDTFTWFKIDREDPTILFRAGVFPSGGQFPTSIAVSKFHGQLCILNGGKVNGVQCFDITESGAPKWQAGTFRPLGITQTTPATGIGNTSSQVIFADRQSKLVVSVKGDFNNFGPPGFVLSWDITRGKLSKDAVKTPAPIGGLLPFGMTVIPHTQAILVTDPGSGGSIYDFAETPAKTSSFTLPGELASCWVERSEATGTYFISDPVAGIIFEASVSSQNVGSFLRKFTIVNGPLDMAIGTISGKDYLYALTAVTPGVSVLKLAPNGHSKLIQAYEFLSVTQSKHIPVTANNLQGMAIYMKH